MPAEGEKVVINLCSNVLVQSVFNAQNAAFIDYCFSGSEITNFYVEYLRNFRTSLRLSLFLKSKLRNHKSRMKLFEYLISSAVSVLLFFNASAKASAPTFPKPFHDRSKYFTVQFAYERTKYQFSTVSGKCSRCKCNIS